MDSKGQIPQFPPAAWVPKQITDNANRVVDVVNRITIGRPVTVGREMEPNGVLVKIVGPATAGGVYHGKLLRGNVPIKWDDATWDSYKIQEIEDCVLLNPTEFDSEEHGVEGDEVVPAIYVGNNADSIPVCVMASGAALGRGTFQHQHFMMVSANQSGWGFPRLHGLLPDS